MYRVYLLIMVCSIGLGCNGVDPANYDRGCVVDTDCGLARLDPCSACPTHAFSADEAARANDDMAGANLLCPTAPICEGEVFARVCKDEVCTMLKNYEIGEWEDEHGAIE